MAPGWRGRRRCDSRWLPGLTVFAGTMAEKMLTYALGRGLEHYDMPAVRAIVRDAGRKDYRFSTIVIGIVNSVPFQMRARASQKPTATRAGR